MRLSSTQDQSCNVSRKFLREPEHYDRYSNI